MKFIVVVFSIICLLSCSSSLVPVDQNNLVKISNDIEQEISALPQSTALISAAKDKDTMVSILRFGAKGDAIQRDDITIVGNMLTLPEDVFVPDDVGKIFSAAHAGREGEHLTGVIKKVINAQKVMLSAQAITNVSNVKGSIGTDNIVSIQRAFDYVIAQNKALFVPEGVYLIGDRNIETEQTAVMINMKKPDQNLTVFGEGKDKTIFRELDGKTQRLGRYTKMFYHYLKNSPNIGTIYLSDLSFDKNGRSLTKNPEVLYSWEQAYCFGWAMSSKELSPSYIKKIHLKNIEIIDKIGAGINFSSGPTKVYSLIADSITERDFNGASGQVQYGQRGDLELSCFSEDIRIVNCDLRYVQLEPVKKFSADKNNLRVCKVIDSRIESLDYTEGDNKEPQYSKLFVDNLYSNKFLVRSIYFRVKNSEISITGLINSVDGGFTNTIIKVPYDEKENKVTPVNSSHLRTLNRIHNNMFFDSCTFKIDNDTPNITPRGAAIKAAGKVENLDQNTITIKNCNFDTRFESSVNAYANGRWILKNNTMAGRLQAIEAGGYRNFVSDLTIEANNYEAQSIHTPRVRINNNNILWDIRVYETAFDKKSFFSVKGSQGDLEKQIHLN